MPEVAAVDGMVFANSILEDGSLLLRLRLRVAGLYETGSSLEDSVSVVSLEGAQPRRVTVLYVKLRDPALADAFRVRMARRL